MIDAEPDPSTPFEEGGDFAFPNRSSTRSAELSFDSRGNQPDLGVAFTPAIDAFLCEHTVMSVAVYANGMLRAASVFYCLERGAPRLLYYSDPSTQHGRLSTANPRMAATIARQETDAAAIRGLQLYGTTELLQAEAAESARATFAAAFPAVDIVPAPIWAFTPSEAKLVDNRLGFGHKELWPAS